MTRGGPSTIARRLIAAAAVLGVGIVVVGGGVAFAGDDAGSGQPVTPGVVTNYRVVVPTLPGGGVVTADEWNWT